MERMKDSKGEIKLAVRNKLLTKQCPSGESNTCWWRRRDFHSDADTQNQITCEKKRPRGGMGPLNTGGETRRRERSGWLKQLNSPAASPGTNDAASSERRGGEQRGKIKRVILVIFNANLANIACKTNYLLGRKKTHLLPCEYAGLFIWQLMPFVQNASPAPGTVGSITDQPGFSPQPEARQLRQKEAPAGSDLITIKCPGAKAASLLTLVAVIMT